MAESAASAFGMMTDSAVDSGPLPQALVAQLEATIVSLRANDRFRPVHLLVPNHVVGALLSRSPFADTGYLAICCELPHEFARRMASKSHLLDGLLPVPEEVDLVLSTASDAVEAEGLATYYDAARSTQAPRLAVVRSRRAEAALRSRTPPGVCHV